MKLVFGLLFSAIPVLLLAQTQPKRFPPEMVHTSPLEVQFRHHYCTARSADGKSLEFQKCAPPKPAVRLVPRNFTPKK
jgi:hypothetical protein